MSGEENKGWSRRRFLAMVGATASVGTVVCCAKRKDTAAPNSAPFPDSPEAEADRVFPQGIASGDPRPDGFLLWARVESPVDEAVSFQVGADEKFSEILAEGSLTAAAASDHTVRVRVEGLKPNAWYWYRFRAMNVSSPVGRTRTAPAADSDVPVTVALASCQDYQGRWYHAYRALADRADEIDFVLFLGDYIYEYERYPQLQEPLPGREVKMKDGLVIDAANGIIAAKSLEDYRGIYRATRADRDLRRIHQLCPFVIIWDDHEHANDAWQDHAADFSDLNGDEKDTARREAATQAWFEHVPVDLEHHPERGYPNDITTWRRLRWGKHVDFWLTDQRYYRSDHAVPEGPPDMAVGKMMKNSPLGSRTFCVKETFEKREAAANPTMLGPEQLEWFIGGMRGSDATWKVWGSALMVAQFVLDLRGFEKIPKGFKNIYYFKTDQWDGFLTERRKILGELAKLENFVTLSGDLHGFYAAHLHENFDAPGERPIGVEFTVAGISSISLAEQIAAIIQSQPMLAATGLGELVPQLDENLTQASPHFVHADSWGYGAGLARFTKEALEVEYLGVTGIREPEWNGEIKPLKFRVASGTSKIERVTASE